MGEIGRIECLADDAGDLADLWREIEQAVSGVIDRVTIDDLRQRCSLPGERLGAALRELERSGRVTRKRGMWWPP